MSCASRPSTRTFSGRPRVSRPRIPLRRFVAALKAGDRPPRSRAWSTHGERSRWAELPVAVPNAGTGPARRRRYRSASAASTAEGSAAPSTTAPSAAVGMSQVASNRTGTERTLPGRRRRAPPSRSRSSAPGRPDCDNAWSDGEPVRLDAPTEEACRSYDAHCPYEKISGAGCLPAQEHVDDDHEREHQDCEERGAIAPPPTPAEWSAPLRPAGRARAQTTRSPQTVR